MLSARTPLAARSRCAAEPSCRASLTGLRSRQAPSLPTRRPLRAAPPPPRAAAAGEGLPEARAAKRWPEEVAPKGVPLPPMVPKKKSATFGFVDNAEVTNSRAAMIGFFALLLLEAVTGKGILELMGIEVGNGIDIGF